MMLLICLSYIFCVDVVFPVNNTTAYFVPIAELIDFKPGYRPELNMRDPLYGEQDF